MQLANRHLLSAVPLVYICTSSLKQISLFLSYNSVCIPSQVTNLEERGRVKCYQYWPSEEGSTYGDIQINLTQTVELSDFTIRTFCLKKANSRAERTVNQYHYTVWPDHGVPSCSTSLLTFVRKASSANPSDAGPMVSWKM